MMRYSIAMLILLSACGKNPQQAVFQTRLSIIAGDRQTDTVARQLAQPVVALAKDQASAQPLPQIVLNWYRVSGTDTTYMAAGITNDSGIGRYRPTLGTKAGDQGIIAWALDNDGNRAQFASASATALAGAAVTFTIPTADTTVVYAGSDTLVLEVRSADSYANPTTPCAALGWSSADSARVKPLDVISPRNGKTYALFLLNFNIGGLPVWVKASPACGAKDSISVQYTH